MVDYPNLEAILDGRVSGQATEWPLIRTELRALFAKLAAAEAEVAEADGVIAVWRRRTETAERERDEANLRLQLGWSDAKCPVCDAEMSGPWTDHMKRAETTERELAALTHDIARAQDALSAEVAARVEVERELAEAQRRYTWAANELLSCDYGDNKYGDRVGWIVWGWRDKYVVATPHNDRRRIYGSSINDAIDAAIATKGAAR